MTRREFAAGLPLIAAAAPAPPSGVLVSTMSEVDFAPTADPDSGYWRGAPPVFAENDPMGKPVPGHKTEVRSRWTKMHLYFLFVCSYDKLYLKPNPEVKAETNRLWNWDVAEVFIGSDYRNIYRYKEFEMSPHAEWVDLDIDRHATPPAPDGGVSWNSGFKVKARIDELREIWYGEMQIPFRSISSAPPQAGQQFRANFYRMQGPPPDRKMIAWQPTHARNYHVPSAFGTLRLA